MTTLINELAHTKLFPSTVRALSNGACDYGRINPNGNVSKLITRAEDEVNEFFDVLNVACGYKPLAMTLRNTGWWRRFRAREPNNARQSIIRRNLAEIIAHSHGIRCIHVKNYKGYDTFYYREKDGLNNVLKLMAIVTNHPKITEFITSHEEYQYMIGKLLGYSIENIRHFLLTRVGFKSTSDFEIDTDNKLEQLQIDLSDFGKKVSILKKPHQIPLETRKISKKTA